MNSEPQKMEPEGPAGPAETPGASGFETAARSHVGTVRTLNEDRLLAADELGLWLVADGMGGHMNGDIAAETVIDEVARAAPSSPGALRAAIDRANRKLVDSAQGSPERVSGSTIIALLLREGRYEYLWTGDSEGWLFRDGRLTKITRDHTLVEEYIRSGAIAETDRRSHPQAHVITRAIGVADLALVDAEAGEWKADDLFLLCSDGLTGAVTPEEIEIFCAASSLEAIADRLIERAITNGASDNVTFILVRKSG